MARNQNSPRLASQVSASSGRSRTARQQRYLLPLTSARKSSVGEPGTGRPCRNDNNANQAAFLRISLIPCPRWRRSRVLRVTPSAYPTRPAISSTLSESPVLSGGRTGAHKIDGVGAGFVVPLWQNGIADRIEQVSTEEAASMAMRLAREEGLFAGTSTGGNVVAALRLAEHLGSAATIVTIMCDTGMKYPSKK